MKRLAAYYLLAACIFLLGYAAYVVVDQWADAEISDLVLLLVFWVLPCVAGIYVVLGNRLLGRPGRSASAEAP